MNGVENRNGRLIAADAVAVGALVRRLEGWICALGATVFAAVCVVLFVWRPTEGGGIFGYLVGKLLLVWLILLGFVYLVVRTRLLRAGVEVAADGITGPARGSVVARLLGRRTTVTYRDIARVDLAVEAGRIRGATIAGSGAKAVAVNRLTDPAVVLQAIRQYVGPDVVWCEASRPTVKLTPTEVEAILERDCES